MKRLGLTIILLLTLGRLYEHPIPPPSPAKEVAKATPHTDQQCAATAVFREASSEPPEGQRAVYEVIMHRAKAQRKSPCAVVKQPRQFSWYNGPDTILPYTKRLQDLMKKVKNHPSVLEGPKFRWFFRRELSPSWAGEMDCKEIGSHKFCREKEEE
jgi:spore germination cell wall hydrolase CwlJ-like protein